MNYTFRDGQSIDFTTIYVSSFGNYDGHQRVDVLKINTMYHSDTNEEHHFFIGK